MPLPEPPPPRARARLRAALNLSRAVAALRGLVRRNSELRRELRGVLFRRSARLPLFYTHCDCRLEARAFYVADVALRLDSIRGITVTNEGALPQ